MDVGRQSAAAYDAPHKFREFWEGRIEVGKTPRSSLPPVPPGRAETISKRVAVLYGEVRD
jgi:hypothetical protein